MLLKCLESWFVETHRMRPRVAWLHAKTTLYEPLFTGNQHILTNYLTKRLTILLHKNKLFATQTTDFGHFNTKSFRYKSTLCKLKSFRDIIKVDSILLNLHVLNCLVVAKKLQSR